MISKIKKINLVILLILASLFVHGQRKGDIGVFGGLSYYLGEINPTIQFQENLPSYGIFYRHIFDLRYSIKTSIYHGEISAHDKNSRYKYQIQRDHSFNLSFIDISSMVEFNFLPYVSTSMKYNFAPYVTAGLAYMSPLSEGPKGTMSIPFGLGFKYNITERLSTGVEWTLRNTFSDEIDGLGEYPDDPVLIEFMSDELADSYRQESLFYRNDMYSFAGLFITYKIAYKRYKCPAYGEIDMRE